MQAGGDYWLLVIQLTVLSEYMTALLEYLDLEKCKIMRPVQQEWGDSNPLYNILLCLTAESFCASLHTK